MTKALSTKLLAVIRMAVVVPVIMGMSEYPALAQKAALIKNADEPGRLPYEVDSEFNKNGCSYACTNFYQLGNQILFDLAQVPAGKRLIIKSVSAFLSASGTGISVAFQTGQNLSQQQVKWAYYGPFSIFDPAGITGMSAQNTFITYGPGESPHVRLFLPNEGNVTSTLNVAGYLIDASN